MAQDKLILVGQVAGGFGVRGEVRVTAYTTDPLTLLAWGGLLRADGLARFGGRFSASRRILSVLGDY